MQIRIRRSTLPLYLFGPVLVTAAAIGTFWFVRTSSANLASARTAIEAEAARGRRVVVATVSQGPKIRTIQLLGDARPNTTATLFAKVSGYLKTVHVDKGNAVVAGQLIAGIESSELESQYQSTLADQDNKQRMAALARDLLRSSSTAQQVAEQAETNLRMAQEAVRNLNAIRSYQVIRAPFDGIVIARFADPGALMQAATTDQASSRPVVHLADTSKLRIGAYVEQRDVTAVKVGDETDIIDAANTNESAPPRSAAPPVARPAHPRPVHRDRPGQHRSLPGARQFCAGGAESAGDQLSPGTGGRPVATRRQHAGGHRRRRPDRPLPPGARGLNRRHRQQYRRTIETGRESRPERGQR